MNFLFQQELNPHINFSVASPSLQSQQRFNTHLLLLLNQITELARRVGGVMDPCPFVRILIANLAVKLPAAPKPAFSGIHPTSSPCFCKIKLKGFAAQFASVPLVSNNDDHVAAVQAACINLNKSQFEKLTDKVHTVKIEVFTGKRGSSCGLSSSKLIGSVSVNLDLKSVESRTSLVHSGWVPIGESKRKIQLHLSVKSEHDPRFVFQFDGEPECSPQVFQVNGNARQPVFTCKFSFRSEHSLRSRSAVSEVSTPNSWLKKGGHREQPERKGWSVIVHDLVGSPVAAASMVTPFVPSPGTDRVSRSNPGAWLILRPGDGTWKPWGRLEAWREPGSSNNLGYRFELLPDAATTGAAEAVTLANAAVSTKNGGKFTIDISSGVSPASTPGSSFDLGSGYGSEQGSGSWAQFMYRGFVMSSTVEGGGKCSKPEVEVGVQHVACKEDAGAFVALAAAMDLSMDACKPFSQKLRKELRQQSQDFVV